MSADPAATRNPPGARLALLGLVGALVCVLYGAFVRVHTALTHPLFVTQSAEGLLKSDPALLFHLTSAVVDAGGGVPEEWRADARIQWPELTDVPAEFTVGEEFLVAWAYLVLGGDAPLHVFAVRLMAFLAASVALCLYGAVFWRTRSPGRALLAAILFSVLAPNYRTLGFVLMREDLALPLFALHLALLARAERARTARAFLFAGFAAAAACASWHALGYFLALEVLVLYLWALRGAESPFEVPGAWAVLVGPVVAAVLVPALAAGGFLFGLPFALALGLLAIGAARASGRLVPRWGASAAALGVAVLWFGLGQLLAGGRMGHAHVLELVVAKLSHGGVRPADPASVSFDARLLWQGPFETMPLADLDSWVGLAGWLLLGLFVARAFKLRQWLGGFELFWLALTLAALPLAWMIGRTVVLLGLLLPGLLVVHRPDRWQRRYLVLVLVLTSFLAVRMRSLLAGWDLDTWYGSGASCRAQAELVEWISLEVDPDEPIASDFVNGAAILAATGNPSILQPKYDTERSRRRTEEWLEALVLGGIDDLTRVTRERFRARLVVLDETLRAELSWAGGATDARAWAELVETRQPVFENGRYRVFLLD